MSSPVKTESDEMIEAAMLLYLIKIRIIKGKKRPYKTYMVKAVNTYETWIAFSGQTFMQRIQLSQRNVQYGRLFFITSAFIGQVCVQIPQPLQSEFAMYIFASQKRPSIM